MFSSFLQKFAINKTCFSLDINVSELRVLQFQAYHENLRIEKCWLRPTPPQALENGRIKNWKIIYEELVALLSTEKIKTRLAFIALPQEKLLCKKISLPASIPAKNLYLEIQKRLADYFSRLLPERLQWDYALLKTEAGLHQLLLHAIETPSWEPYFSLIKRLGLQITCIDGDLYARTRALAHALSVRGKKEATALLLAKQDERCVFLLFRESILVYSEQWEDRQPEKFPFKEMQRHWQIVKDYYPALKVEFLGYCLNAEADESLWREASQEIFNVSPCSFSPWEGISLPSHYEGAFLREMAPRFLLCTGLALRGLGGLR